MSTESNVVTFSPPCDAAHIYDLWEDTDGQTLLEASIAVSRVRRPPSPTQIKEIIPREILREGEEVVLLKCCG